MRSRYFTVIAMSAVLLASTGCVQYASLLDLNPDGSGTVTIRMLLSDKADSSIGKMFFGSEDDDDAKAKENLEAGLEQFASELGIGVTLKSKEPVGRKGWNGIQAVFGFEDINTVRLPIAPPGKEREDKEKAMFSSPPSFTFEFTGGESPKLIVRTEESPKESDSEPEDPFAAAGLDLPEAPSSDFGFGDAIAVQIAKSIFATTRLSTMVRINGEVTQTNAINRPKPESIMLCDFDMGQFAESSVFDKATKQKWDFDRLVQEKVPGLKTMARGEEILVEFQAK